MKRLDILVGADPEVFMKRKGAKTFTSAHGVVPGTKENPHRVENGAVQVDGMALEFNIDPAKDEDQFVENLTSVMGQLEGMIDKKVFELHAVPTATFTPEHMRKQPKEALELGCDPDFNAWNRGQANPRPDAGNARFRTGAGHVHIGWGKDLDVNDPTHIEACIMAAKQLDYYLGLGSLLFDKDNKRRKLYGKAGAFRVKPYGMEYRVLSNKWLESPELMRWVYQTTDLAIQRLFNGKRAYDMWGNRITDMINDGCYKESVRPMMNHLGIEPPRA